MSLTRNDPTENRRVARCIAVMIDRNGENPKERKGSNVSQLNPEFSIITMESMNPRKRKRKLGSTRHTPTLSIRDQTVLFNEGLAGLEARKKRAA